jgi:hypothetical protein
VSILLRFSSFISRWWWRCTSFCTFVLSQLNSHSSGISFSKQTHSAYESGVRLAVKLALSIPILIGPSAIATDYPSPACRLVSPALVGFQTDDLADLLPAERRDAEYLLEVLRGTRKLSERLYVFRTKLDGFT